MNQEEKVLRQSIRQLIRHVKQKKLDEEFGNRDDFGIASFTFVLV